MHTEERTRFVAAWERVARGLASITELLPSLPVAVRPALLQLLDKLNARQLRSYEQIVQCSTASPATSLFIEAATDLQCVLAQEMAKFFVCIHEGARGSGTSGPALQLPSPDFDPSTYADRFAAALNQLQSAQQAAASSVLALERRAGLAASTGPPNSNSASPWCSVCRHPVQPVYLAPRSTQAKGLGGAVTAEIDFEADDDDDERDALRRRSKRSPRRGRENQLDGFASRAMKGLGGTGTMLCIAMVLSGIAFGERIVTSRTQDRQAVAFVQDSGGERTAAIADATSSAADSGKKPFANRLESPVATAVAAPSQPAVQAPTPISAMDDNLPGSISSIKAIEPVRGHVQETALSGPKKGQPAEVKMATKVASRTGAPISTPTPVNVATGAPTSRPIATARPATPPAPSVDEGDGLYVAVLSTHKDGGAAREEFAELQKKYTAILGSKQSEVQVINGQTGSWHRLVATPASTKAASNELCNELRSAGYGRCWVKPY